MKSLRKVKMLQYSALILMAICLTQVNAEKQNVSSKKKCGATLDNAIDKFEFNQKNASLHCNFTIKPKAGVNVTEIFLLFEKMILDDGDNVTVTTIPKSRNISGEILGSFTVRSDAFVLITGVEEVFVELITSSREVQRELAVSSQAQVCAFTIHDDIPTISQPIYAPNATDKECEFIYDIKVDPNVTFAFSFDAYNMDRSHLDVRGAVGQINIPDDFFSGTDQVTVTAVMSPQYESDHFVLRRHITYSKCSGMVYVSSKENMSTPALPELIDQDVPKECHWHFQSKDGNEALGVKFKNINLENNFDIVTMIDGSQASLSPLLQVTRSTQNASLAQEIRTSSSNLILIFKPESFNSNLTFDVIRAGSGRYLKNNGTVRATGVTENQNDTIFLLEVPSGKYVVLNFKTFALTPPAALEIYEDFTMKSRKIATLQSDVWYPVISSTSRIMIAAINFAQGEFEGTFGAAPEGCMHMSPGTSDSYVLSGNCKATCSWIIPPVDYKDGLLLLDMQYLSLEAEDVITVLHLDKNRTVVASITSKTNHVPQLSLNTAIGAFVNVTRGACKKADDVALVARANYLPDCSQSYTVSPSDVLQLTSPSYPDTYPLFSHCNSSIKPAVKNQMLHLAFEKLELAADHCIQISYVSENGSSSFQVMGDQMPDDFILSGEVSVLFNSGSCNTTKGVSAYASKQGFLLNATALDCGGVITDKTGKLTVGANTSLCIFKVTVPMSETDGSVNIIIYSLEDGKLGNYKVHVHDGATVRAAVINNNTETDIWSHTNSLMFVYERIDSTKPSGDMTIKYQTKSCDKLSLCDNGICMHPDWKCNGKNDCGDYSDEKNCESAPPTPTPALDNSGISPVAFGICIILFFALGICITLCTPWALQKYRNRYRPFQDLSVIE